MSLSDLPEAVRAYLTALESGDVSTLSRWIAADVVGGLAVAGVDGMVG